MSAVLYVVILILVLIVVAALLMTFGFNYAKNDEWVLAFGTPANTTMYNCQIETVYSITDGHCRTQCEPPGIYKSVDGICVNIMELSEGALYRNECDPKKGVFSYIVGDNQFGKLDLRCLSIDPGIQPDNVHLPNRICTGNVASVDIDYLSKHGYPKWTDCVCKEDNELVEIPPTLTIRSRGLCVSRHMARLFSQ